MDKKPLTVAELAARWRCSTGLIRKLIASGKLAAFRVGKLVRISPEAVASCEGQNAAAAQAEAQAAAQAAWAEAERMRQAANLAHARMLGRGMKR